MDRTRFIEELSQSVLEETEKCHGFCSALKKMTSEVIANDKEIMKHMRWEPENAHLYHKALKKAKDRKKKSNSESPSSKNPPGSPSNTRPPGKGVMRLPGWRRKWMTPSGDHRFPGRVRFRRLLKQPANTVHRFRNEAMESAERIRKKLRGKSASIQELKFKLTKEYEEKILYFLDEFIQLKEVQDAGVNKANVLDFLNFSGLLLVTNLASQSSPLRVVANPAQKTRSGYQLNDNLASGDHYIEKVISIFMRLRLNPAAALADIENFYLRIRLNPAGSLSGAVFLQRDEDGSPTLDPDCDSPLEPAVFVASRFGSVDAGGLAGLARNNAADMYLTHYPDNDTKLPEELVTMVEPSIQKAYVDDCLLTVSAKEMEDNNELFSKEGYVAREGSETLEVKAMAISRVLEFVGFTLKKYVVPPDQKIQAKLNKNPLLRCNNPVPPKVGFRPPAEEVHKEGTPARLKYDKPSEKKEPMEHLLGIAWLPDDTLKLRQKKINVGRLVAGVKPKETEIGSPEAFDNFIQKHGSLTKRQHLSLVSQAYNPLGDLAGIYHLASRIINREILLQSEVVLGWEDKVDPTWMKPSRELVKLFYLLQDFSIPRFILARFPPSTCETSFWALTDGSPQAAAALVYSITTPPGGIPTVLLFRCILSTSSLAGRTTAANECLAAEMGLKGLLEVAREAVEAGVTIKEIGLIVDANYVLDLLRNYAGRLKPPFCNSVARSQLILAELAALPIRARPSLFSSCYYLDQFFKIPHEGGEVKGKNYADLVSKVSVEEDTAEAWMERWEEIHRAEWLHLDRKRWVHIANVSKDLIRKKTQKGEEATLPQFKAQKGSLIENFMIEVPEEEPPATSPPPLIVRTHDLRAPGGGAHLSQPNYNLYKKSPYNKMRDTSVSAACLKKFGSRANPLRCSMLVAGAVMFASKKFLALRKRKSPGSKLGTYEEARDISMTQGLWLLTAESSEYPGSHLTPLRRTLKDMEVIAILFAGREVPVALGRELREHLGREERQARAKAQYYVLRLLRRDSPLVQLILRDFHQSEGHNCGPATLMNTAIREGFLWPSIERTFKEFNDKCPRCQYKRAAFRKVIRYQAVFGPDSTLLQMTSEDIMNYVVIDQTGPFPMAEGIGKFHILMAVELVSRRCHLIPIRNMSTEAIIIGLQILCGRRGKWKTLVADEATAHRGLATESSMREVQVQDISHRLIPREDTNMSMDLVGYLKRKKVQEKADRLKLRFKIVSAKSHHNVGLAEDISRRLKLLSYDVFGEEKVQDVFEAFHRTAILEGAINDRIIAIEPDGSILTPNSFAYAQGLHSNHPGADLSEMSSAADIKITDLLEQMKNSTRKILKKFANHYVSHLLQFTRQRHDVKDLAKGDIVMILDRVTPHKFTPAATSVGRIHEVSSGQRQFRIKLTGKVFRKSPKRRAILFVNRPRKNLVLLARPADNQDRPVFVDPWVGVTNQAIVEQGYNPLKVNFSLSFDVVPANEEEATTAAEDIADGGRPSEKRRSGRRRQEEVLYSVAPGDSIDTEPTSKPRVRLEIGEPVEEIIDSPALGPEASRGTASQPPGGRGAEELPPADAREGELVEPPDQEAPPAAPDLQGTSGSAQPETPDSDLRASTTNAPPPAFPEGPRRTLRTTTKEAAKEVASTPGTSPATEEGETLKDPREPPRRPRGRPRKTPQEPPAGGEEPSEPPSRKPMPTGPEDPPKRKRGRPRKVPQALPAQEKDPWEPPKKPRGRPRKIVPASPARDEDPREPPKRKRGRPRKEPPRGR